jgi:catechol 2,3-dioxygenase-like lactoylglutathione lyase family enzyme
MKPKGFSHVGMATLDLDKTREFYEGVLGFEPVRCDSINLTDGGQIRHIFFDAGRDQLLAFMEIRGAPGVPKEFDAGINRALGLPTICYHYAFDAGTEAALEEKRQELVAKGVKVSPVVDHDWAKSIYFKDPNGLQLEFCTYTRAFNADDAVMKLRFEASLKGLSMEEDVDVKAVDPRSPTGEPRR